VRHGGQHPGSERLEEFAQSGLSDGDRVVVESHLLHCASCQAEVEDWRSLFVALSDLPLFTPAAGFGDRVMARVRIPLSWPQRVGLWSEQAGRLIRDVGHAVERVLPKTTRGWAFASAFLALPALFIGGLLFWLVSRSYVTMHGLWVFTTDSFGAVATGSANRIFEWLIMTPLASWTVSALGGIVETRGASGLGMLAGGLGVAMALSVWILYMNLFRTDRREANYVTNSI
jgi:hypothetical protein